MLSLRESTATDKEGDELRLTHVLSSAGGVEPTLTGEAELPITDGVELTAAPQEMLQVFAFACWAKSTHWKTLDSCGREQEKSLGILKRQSSLGMDTLNHKLLLLSWQHFSIFQATLSFFFYIAGLCMGYLVTFIPLAL